MWTQHRQPQLAVLIVTSLQLWNELLLVHGATQTNFNESQQHESGFLVNPSNSNSNSTLTPTPTVHLNQIQLAAGLQLKKEEYLKLKSTPDLMRNEAFVRLIQKQRVETESELEGETEDELESSSQGVPSQSQPQSQSPPPQSERPQILIIKSHPILTSSSLTTSIKPGVINKKQQQQLQLQLQQQLQQQQHQQIQIQQQPEASGSISTLPVDPVNMHSQTQSQPISTSNNNNSHKPTMMIVSDLFASTSPQKNVIPSQAQVQSQTQIENQNVHLKSQLDDLFSKVSSFPQPTPPHLLPTQVALPSPDGIIQSFQNIKDAYFEVLVKLRDFRNTVSKRFEMVESQIKETTKMLNRTIHQPPAEVPQPISAQMDLMSVQNMYLKMSEMERRFNISRLVDHCVHFLLSNNLPEAFSHWSKLEMLTAPNVSETSANLAEIIKLAYARNSSNTSPIFPFLRKLHGVEKIPLYDSLINGMKARDDFDGSEIFHIAQYLKERNAVRSSIYSKIPKAVQYAVSGRNVNIVYFEKRSGRNYLHVRDDQRRDRLNFYIQASQSYTDSRSAVWNVIFESASETFRLKNTLFGEYMYVNDEGFLETVSANTATSMGTEFNFILMKDKIMIQSKTYAGEPLVVVRGGGKFPYYFSLMRENPHAVVAEFLMEPDTLL